MTTDRSTEHIRHVLLALLRDEDDEASRAEAGTWGDDEWAELLAEAKRQRIVNLVFDRIRACGLSARLPESARAGFARSARGAVQRGLRLHAELASMLDAFAAAALPVILLKGAYLGSTVYRHPGLRDMADLDLLVPVPRLKEAASLVFGLGYAPRRRFDVDVVQAVAHHLPPCIKRGAASVEVHWNITPPWQVVSIDPAALWERSMPAVVLGRRVRALCPEDLALHLCIHVSYQHLFGFGLRSLCDLHLVLKSSSHPIDWQTFCARARAWQCERGVFLALQVACDLLHAAVPPEVLGALRPQALPSAAVEFASHQVFADPVELQAFGGEITRLAGDQTLQSRWRHVRARLFVGRLELAALSGGEPEMSRFRQALLYARRFAYLLTQYARPAIRLARGGTRGADVAIRQKFLREWLAS